MLDGTVAFDDFLKGITYPHANLEAAKRVWADRYAMHDPYTGDLLEENFSDTARRVAGAIANGDDSLIEPFYEALDRMELVPGGRIYAAAGLNTGEKATLSNCFVVPIYDTREGITDTMGWVFNILSKGGGVGVNFTPLRGRGSVLKSSRGIASGPCSFITAINALAHCVNQGGSRRGAMMGQLSVDHPDILQFIHWKANHPYEYVLDDPEDVHFKAGAWEHLNVSVQITNDFLARLKRGDADAVNIWEHIAHQAWGSGDPGLFFIDRVNERSNAPYAPIICANPCGEQPLPEFGSCNLASINLAALVRGGKMDWQRLYDLGRLSTTFLDNVLDINDWPLPQIEAANIRDRRVGTGTVGLADACLALGIKYGSSECLKLVNEVYRTITLGAYRQTAELARTRGKFGGFDLGYYDRPFVKQVANADPALASLLAAHGARNVTLTTQAPTGSISQLAGVNGGIEPFFLKAWKRFDRVHPEGVIMLHPKGDDPNFVQACDLDGIGHVRVQAVAQEWTDSAISKTVNLPHEATVEHVKEVYNYAIEHDLSGITVYRDGCRDGVSVLNGISDAEVAAAIAEKQQEEYLQRFAGATCVGGKCDL